MIICEKCKQLIPVDSKFCPHCGKKVENDGTTFYAAAMTLKNSPYINFEGIILDLLIKSAKLGCVPAIYEIGLIYSRGSNYLQPNLDYAKQCMFVAANKDYQEAIVFILMGYLYGKYGMTQDKDKAIEYYKKLDAKTRKAHYRINEQCGKYMREKLESETAKKEEKSYRYETTHTQKRAKVNDETSVKRDQALDDFKGRSVMTDNVENGLICAGTFVHRAEKENYLPGQVLPSEGKHQDDKENSTRTQTGGNNNKFLHTYMAKIINNVKDKPHASYSSKELEEILLEEKERFEKFKLSFAPKKKTDNYITSYISSGSDPDATQKAIEDIRSGKSGNETNEAAFNTANAYFGYMQIAFNDGTLHDILIGDETIHRSSNAIAIYGKGTKEFDAFINNSSAFIHSAETVQLVKKRIIKLYNWDLISAVEIFNAKKGGSNIAPLIVDDRLYYSDLQNNDSHSNVESEIKKIEELQREIISSNLNDNLVIQSSVGSGAAAILSKRIEYLKVNNVNSEDITIIVPGKATQEFILNKLATSGIKDVKCLNISDLYSLLLDKVIPNKNISCALSSTCKNVFGFDQVKYLPDSDVSSKVYDHYYSDQFYNDVKNSSCTSLNAKVLKDSDKYKSNKNEFDFLGGLTSGTEFHELLDTHNRGYGNIHRCELFALCLMACSCFVNAGHAEELSKLLNLKNVFIYAIEDFAINELKLINELRNANSVINFIGDFIHNKKQNKIHSLDNIKNICPNVNYFECKIDYYHAGIIVNYINKTSNQRIAGINVISGNYSELRLPDVKKAFEKDAFKDKKIICADKKEKSNLYRFSDLDPKNIIPFDDCIGVCFDSVYVWTNNMSLETMNRASRFALKKLVIVK